MRRLFILAVWGLAFALILASGTVFAQATFKIPFKFIAEGKSYSPGNYWIAQIEEEKITIRKEAAEEAVSIPIIEKLARPDQPIEKPQLIFDMVGNFEPSYTEYVTEYVLAEVWLTEKDGFLVSSAERSEYNKTVEGVKAEK